MTTSREWLETAENNTVSFEHYYLYTIGIKLSIFWNFGTHFLTHEIKQTCFISSEQGSILTLTSYAFIHTIGKWYICLMHSLLKNWRLLDGPEVHVNDDNFSYYLLLTIICKFERMTLPSFNRFKLQMTKLSSFLASNFAFVSCHFWVPLIVLLLYPLNSDIFFN